MKREERPRRATIHDVARSAGVSAATVSKVLRGVATVRKENADRVRTAVAELDYRMDPLASSLRNESRRIIGAVVPDLESPFFGALVTGLQDAAERAGYHLIVASSRESEEREAELVARMNDWRVAGTLLAPVRSERGRGAETLRALDMQAVLVDRVSDDERYDTVSADNYQASANVADFLLGLGHRHVLLHGATQVSKAIRTRLAGFTERAKALDAGVQVDTVLSDADADVPHRSICKYFETRAPADRPTAVFSLSQHSTLRVAAELRRRGIRVPEDIALVGFDDADWMQTTWPSITAVAQPVHTMAEHAMATLLARIEGNNDGAPVQHLEACEMLVRESAGPETEVPRRRTRGN
ncbi:LacI family DNA-binding transcriptional regulator [Tropicimonas isoalkanivorans]|uniref:Transcriptional regulator, LacI family n=1 Tax=Tropicimonas isoalkanivorans TaxID=441112 RepID=A0A1I1IW97_9RHOB|nr:LacI family DNA-binding transcriptional regulator [Tropicimonas isoalkanivorans]SFC40161.1 transcriptional regulator, LacI family [Tropicimonas isoalkanivorans]